MSAVLRYLPTREGLYRRRAKISGFLFGVLVMLAMGVFASVLATGHPIDLGPPKPVQVYTNF